jgi:hypothetical protein
VGRDVTGVRFSDAGVLVLVAGDSAKAEVIKDLLLDVLLKH